jgi:hypothetical protein
MEREREGLTSTNILCRTSGNARSGAGRAITKHACMSLSILIYSRSKIHDLSSHLATRTGCRAYVRPDPNIKCDRQACKHLLTQLANVDDVYTAGNKGQGSSSHNAEERARRQNMD